MSTFTRGRGISRSINENQKVGPVGNVETHLQQLHKDIMTRDLDKILESLNRLYGNKTIKGDEEESVQMTDYFLEHSFKDEELAMNFTLHFPYVLERWEGLKKFARLKYLNDLQTRYGDFDIFEYNKKYLRICSIHVVSQFKMSSADSKGYQFLVEPIMKSFELLMNSDEKPDIDCFAILFTRCWEVLKNTSPENFDKMLVDIRKKIIQSSERRITFLFLLDLSSGQFSKDCSALKSFYIDEMSKEDQYNLSTWTTCKTVRSIFSKG